MGSWSRGWRFDSVELTAAIALTCFATLVVARQWEAREDTKWLRDAYGPAKYSYNAEEWIVRDFFRERRNGIFADVGAADARQGSNTYYLESKLGWSGIAVDALEEYRDSYTRFRPRTRFVVAFASDVAEGHQTLYVSPTRTESSSFLEPFAAFYARSPLTKREVPTVRLTDLLDDAGVSHIDFLSLDIELAEPKALAGFDIERFRPALVCVEAHPPIRQILLDYFTQHGYTLVAKYLVADITNFYFMPLSKAESRRSHASSGCSGSNSAMRQAELPRCSRTKHSRTWRAG